MIGAPSNSLPHAYLHVINSVAEAIRSILENGGQSVQLAAAGNFTTEAVIVIDIDTCSLEDKDESAKKISLAAHKIDADFIITVLESWTLPQNKLAEREEILDKYGSIGKSPYAVDICAFTIEARHGMWVACPQIKPKGNSKKKRTFGALEFLSSTETQGRFAHLLPKKESNETSSPLP